MAFDTLAEFIQMGRHGLYVWMSYGLTLILIALNLLLPFIDKKQALSVISANLKRERKDKARSESKER